MMEQIKKGKKMTISQNLIKRSLVINVEDGVNADGNSRTRSRTYSDIREDSTPENLYNAGIVLAGLMASPLSSITITDRSELVEE